MIIDFHTHRVNSKAALSIYNLDHLSAIPQDNTFLSAGLHPWYITESTLAEEFRRLENLVSHSNVLLIGECGLDKVCQTDFELQMRAFNMQLALANKIGKALVIHCVRAHNEILKLLVDSKNEVPVIFHGFNKNDHIAENILARGHFFSFGADLLMGPTAAVFAKIPSNRIFLESDDASIDIHAVYERASQLKGMALTELEAQIEINLHTILGPEFKIV